MEGGKVQGGGVGGGDSRMRVRGIRVSYPTLLWLGFGSRSLGEGKV